MQPMSSAISGVLEQAAMRLSSTGAPLGETASANLPTVDNGQVRDWLVRQGNPAAVDQALSRLLISSLGVETNIVREGRYPEGGRPYTMAVACDVAAPNRDAVQAAIAKVEAAMTPPDREQIQRWLVGLQVATKSQRSSETTSIVALELYSSTLMRYPADVAKSACANLAIRAPAPGETNWFPSLGELVGACDRLVSPRAAMLVGLRAWRERTVAETVAEERRSWRILEIDARNNASLCRRGDPERHSELIEFAEHAKMMARAA